MEKGKAAAVDPKLHHKKKGDHWRFAFALKKQWKNDHLSSDAIYLLEDIAHYLIKIITFDAVRIMESHRKKTILLQHVVAAARMNMRSAAHDSFITKTHMEILAKAKDLKNKGFTNSAFDLSLPKGRVAHYMRKLAGCVHMQASTAIFVSIIVSALISRIAIEAVQNKGNRGTRVRQDNVRRAIEENESLRSVIPPELIYTYDIKDVAMKRTHHHKKH